MAIGVVASRPAAHDKAVVLTASPRYAPFAWMVAKQLDALAPARDFDICIASGEEIKAVAGLGAGEVRRLRFDVGDLFAGLHCDHRRPPAAYLRLALPAALGGDYRRVLYLDSDVFIQGGDFSALLEVGMGSRPVAAVRDNIQWRTPGRRSKSFRRLGLPVAPFFNSGVMLFDTAAFRDQQVLERCLALSRQHPASRIGLDQDLINAVLRGGWAELAPTWNWQNTWASRFFESMVNPHVVHFIGPSKPWSHTDGQLPLRYRRAYRAFFAEHMPEGPQIDGDGLPPHRNRRYLYRSLLKHFVSVGKVCDYLDRFESDLTVHL